MITAQQFAERLESSTPAASGGFTACCPAHDDRINSLSIGTGDDGRTLLHCHAGCETKDIVSAIGVNLSDLFPSKNGRANGQCKIVAEYKYRDAAGELRYEVVRFEPKDFRQRCPKPGGGWTWTLKGIDRLLYRLPELLAADKAEPVYVVEGEKDADNLAALGLVSTTNSGGAAKWETKFSDQLAGRSVVILPDNDVPGRKHARIVAASLVGKAASIKILEFPGLPEKADVSDWIYAGGTAQELLRLAAQAPEWEPSGNETESTAHTTAPIGDSFANFKEVPSEESGNTIKAPLSMGAIIGSIEGMTDGWPRRVGQALFVPGERGNVDWLPNASAMFGWLQSRGPVYWSRMVGAVGKLEFHAELQRTAEAYQAVELLPHEPPIAGHYYSGSIIKPGDGEALRQLVDRFNPAADVDHELIRAAFMTVFWGGRPGSRPCFVVTSDDGRGAGKSTLVEMIGHVAGGCLGFSHNEDIGTIKQRLLSPDALTKRLCLLDNVKSLKFSWGELEGMITAPEISGKRMYVGDASRPNTLTWFITLNGASLSTDMAQRAVIINVSKPPRRDGTWHEETVAFIADNRQAITGDIIAALRKPAAQLAKFSRWASWEAEVLARIERPDEAQRLILERQAAVDVEEEEAALLEEFFGEQLGRLGYDVEREMIHVPAEAAARWFNWCHNTNDRVTSVSRVVKQMHDEGKLTRIEPNPSRARGRGFLWVGVRVDVDASPRYDLREMLSKHKPGALG